MQLPKKLDDLTEEMVRMELEFWGLIIQQKEEVTETKRKLLEIYQSEPKEATQ